LKVNLLKHAYSNTKPKGKEQKKKRKEKKKKRKENNSSLILLRPLYMG